MTSSTPHQCLLAAFTAVIAMLPAGCGVAIERQPIGRPIQFTADEIVKGIDSMLVPGATLLIGEIHGTWEIPILIASLARDAFTKAEEVVVCLEVPSTEQASIARFLESDGGQQAMDDLVKPPFWLGQDGRASVGMLAMLELLRRLHSKGKNIHVKAIDYDGTSQSTGESATLRDSAMADRLIRARTESPDAIVIVLAGNVHTTMTKGAAWDKEYVPMGWFAIQSIPNLLSLDVAIAGGEAWLMSGRDGGITTLRGKDEGNEAFVRIHDAPESGYHGILYVGRISAAAPALREVEK